MSAALPQGSAQAARALLAKLVIGISTLVALASSPPPRWLAKAEQQLEIVFDERNERTAILSVDLAGKLYADLAGGTLEVWATADRSASDLVLSVRPLTLAAGDAPPRAPAELQLEAELPDAASSPSARPDVRQPNIARLSLPLACAEHQPTVPRAESCSEQLEITLTRESQRPLSVELSVVVFIDGTRKTQPSGVFALALAEPAP